MKCTLALAVVTVLWLSSVASAASKTAPCNLSKAPTVAQARIQATCVRANKSAKNISDNYGVVTHTFVRSDACEVRSSQLAVCDFTITRQKNSKNRAAICSGDVSIRGQSKDPRLLIIRLREIKCRTTGAS